MGKYSGAPDEEEADRGFFESFGHHAGDIAMAPLRGVEGALQGTYGLIDEITGDSFLPDYDQRFIGGSKTFAGNMLEDVVQFSAGFLPGLGALKAGKGLLGLRGILSSAAEKALAKKSAAKALALRIGRDAVAGAAADFTVFSGQEERLSNLLESHPILANPITEYLAHEEGDSEMEGRFKATLEGLGLGVGVDLLFSGLRGIRRARRKSAQKAAAAEIDRAGAEGIDEEALRKGVAGDQAEQQPLSDLTIRQTGLTAQSRAKDVLKAVDFDGVVEKVAMKAGERIKKGLDPNVNPRKMNELELFEQGMREESMNMASFAGNDVLQVSRALEEVMLPQYVRLQHGPSRTTMERVLQDGIADFKDTLGARGSVSDFGARMTAPVDPALGTPGKLARVFSQKLAINFTHDKMVALAKRIWEGEDLGEKGYLELQELIENHAKIKLDLAGHGTDYGQGLWAMSIPTRDMSDPQVKSLLAQVGGKKGVKELAGNILLYGRNSDGSAHGKGLAVVGSKALKVATEVWMNGLVGRMTTQVINGTGSALMTVFRPFERAISGAMISAFNGKQGRLEVAKAGQQLYGLLTSFKESLKFAHRRLQMGEIVGKNAAPPKTRTGWLGRHSPEAQRAYLDATRQQAISSKDTGLKGILINNIGNIVNFPFRSLGTVDEFFKQLNGRTDLRSTLVEEAIVDRGLSGRQAREYVENRMKQVINDEGQLLSRQDLLKEGYADARARGLTEETAEAAAATRQHALEFMKERQPSVDLSARYSQETTFTSPSDPETWTRSIEDFTRKHPVMRFFGATFVRTPVNLLKQAGQRTDVLGLLDVMRMAAIGSDTPTILTHRNRLVKDYLSGTPREKAEAIGRITTGFSAFAYMGSLALDNEDGLPTMTGSGPKNPAERKLWLATGMQPYSFKRGDKYISYARFDPFSTIFGLAADLAEAGLAAGPEHDAELQSVGAAMAASLASNFANKSYMRGFAEFTEAITDQGAGMDRWMARFAASWVPGQVAQFAGLDDTAFREVRGMADAIRAKIPGLSAVLPPARNALGETVDRWDQPGVWNLFNPARSTTVKDDIISKEFRLLGHGFQAPGQLQANVNLSEIRLGNTNAHDKYSALAGTVKLNGRTLRKALRREIKSSAYQRMSPESFGDLTSPRVAALKKIIRRYRRKAWTELVRQEPDVRAAASQMRTNRHALKYNPFSPLTDI